MEIEPITPRLAGRRKTPEPIIVLVTSMVARNGPIFLWHAVSAMPVTLASATSATLLENRARQAFIFPPDPFVAGRKSISCNRLMLCELL
jgi:hypothetical protein